MADLKLIALDAEDLPVLSAHLQDAVLRVGDIAYLPREKRFAAIANRFDWAAANGKSDPDTYLRRRAALRFESVTDAKLHGVDLRNKSAVLALLAITFEPAPEPPAGLVILHFADGVAIRLQVDYIEAELTDLGPVWQAKSKPQHSDDDPPAA
jgi:hypothetical protein